MKEQGDREVILITGASRGIGESIAREFASSEVELLLVARSEEDLSVLSQELVASKGGEVRWRSVDLCDASQREALIEEVKRTCAARLRGVILGAGVAHSGDFLTRPVEHMRQEMCLNYEAPLELIRAFLPDLLDREGAFLVAVSSLTSLISFPGHTSYSASKGALTALMRSLAAEYVDREAHIGVVLPGYTDTTMTQNLESLIPAMKPGEVAQALRESIEKREPIHIPGVTNKLANLTFQLFPTLSYQALSQLGEYLIPTEHA